MIKTANAEMIGSMSPALSQASKIDVQVDYKTARTNEHESGGDTLLAAMSSIEQLSVPVAFS